MRPAAGVLQRENMIPLEETEAVANVAYEIPNAGFLEGDITDANDGLAVSGTRVVATNASGKQFTASSNSDGSYRLHLSAGTYQLEVSKKHYASQMQTVAVLESQTVSANFVLDTARAVLEPATLELVLAKDEVRTRNFRLTNEGLVPMEFEVREAGGQKKSRIATALRKRNVFADPDARTTRDLFLDSQPSGLVSPSSPGDIISSFRPAESSFVWGIGQDIHLWLSDIDSIGNHEYEVDGTPTGRRFSANWSGGFPADMAFDSSRGLMCQIAVGGDDGIHCWDPTDGTVIDTIGGAFPWTKISQRGLAYSVSDDTFYIGGWNDETVYHIQGLSHSEPGAVLSSCRPADGSIAGLAYNDAMDVLWATTNSEFDLIYELNPRDCTVLSTLPFPESGGYLGAGLEMDEEGNLWLVSQESNNVYLLESGVPAFGDIPWLSAAPTMGLVDVNGETNIEITVDTQDLEAGLYLGSVFVNTNSGRNPTLRVPVSLVVSDYVQGVNAGGRAYNDSQENYWDRDQAHQNGSWGYVQRGRRRGTRSSIDNTDDPRLYRSQRENPYAYRYDDVPNGIYEIDFRFAELRRVGYGDRLFDVIVEDTLVLPTHDIHYEVGRNYADDHKVWVQVDDERLDVRFVPRSGYRSPVVNALRVLHRPDR